MVEEKLGGSSARALREGENERGRCSKSWRGHLPFIGLVRKLGGGGGRQVKEEEMAIVKS
jgi:hypothetical protein